MPNDPLHKSTAILYSKPTYVQVLRNDLVKNVGYWHPVNGFTPSCSMNGCLGCSGTLEYYKSPSSIRPMSTTQGSHIGYKEVRVKETGNGESVYRYFGPDPWTLDITDVAHRSVNTQLCDPSIPNYPAAPLPHDFKRGELIYEKHSNEAGEPVKEAWYNSTYVNNPRTTPGLIITSKGIGTVASQYLGTYYELNTARKTTTEVTERVYAPGGNSFTTTRTTHYESNYHNQPTRTVTTGSTGKVTENKIKYAFDFRNTACDAISDCSQELTTANASCLTQYNTARLACASGDGQCLTTAYLNYMYCQTQARQSYVSCRQSNLNTLLACQTDAKANADASLKPVLELREKFINAPIEMTDWKDSKLLSASFHSYDYVSSPSTHVYVDHIDAIDLAAPSTTFTSATNSNTTLTRDSRYKLQSDVKFYNGNLVEVKARNGVPTSYVWGHNNSLPIVKAVGVDHATLTTAYDAVGGDLSQLRTQTSLQPAMVATYTYVPLMGMTSEADANNKNTSYEYDALQRLRLIRDKDNNVVKQISYAYHAYAHTNAVWEVTGNTRCKPCSLNSSYVTNMLQREERNVNAESGGFGDTRWVDMQESSSCAVASWQNTTTPVRCKVVNGQNTGELEQEQKDMNPCSGTYNIPRWVVVGINESTCPIPVVYAKVTYDNDITQGSEYFSDVVISFYQDQACTTPIAVSNLVVQLREDIYSSYSGTTGNQYSTYTCNGTSTRVIERALRHSEYPDGTYETHTFYVVAGQGYLPGN